MGLNGQLVFNNTELTSNWGGVFKLSFSKNPKIQLMTPKMTLTCRRSNVLFTYGKFATLRLI